MHVRVVALVITWNRFYQRARLLRRRRVIEINQWMTMNTLVQDRKIASERLPIYRRLFRPRWGGLSHHAILVSPWIGFFATAIASAVLGGRPVPAPTASFDRQPSSSV